MTPLIDENSTSLESYNGLRGRVRKALEENIGSDETIWVIIHGAGGQAMVGTDRRVFVCKPGLLAGAAFGAEITTWTYKNLVGVQLHKGMMTGAVVLQGPGQSGTRTSYWGQKGDDPYKAPNAIPVAGNWKHVRAEVAFLAQIIADTHNSPDEASRGAPSTADELRKLADLRDQGVLTEDEFAAAKERILGNL